MRNSTVFVVGFSAEQRRTLMQALERWRVNTVAVTDEAALFQYLWPCVSADRLTPRPDLLVLDGMRLSSDGIELVGNVCRGVELLVHYQTDTDSGFHLLLDSLRRRFQVSPKADSPTTGPHPTPRRARVVETREQRTQHGHQASE